MQRHAGVFHGAHQRGLFCEGAHALRAPHVLDAAVDRAARRGAGARSRGAPAPPPAARSASVAQRALARRQLAHRTGPPPQFPAVLTFAPDLLQTASANKEARPYSYPYPTHEHSLCGAEQSICGRGGPAGNNSGVESAAKVAAWPLGCAGGCARQRAAAWRRARARRSRVWTPRWTRVTQTCWK